MKYNLAIIALYVTAIAVAAGVIALVEAVS